MRKQVMTLNLGIACLISSQLTGLCLAKDSKSRPSKPPNQAEEMVLDLGSSAKVDTGKFEELKFEKSLVIEAKVERPQVQFPLLKEAPPEKSIPFEASFRDELLAAPRENTFQLK